jgi:hypothetical protein
MADTTFTVTVGTGTTFRAGGTGNVYFINGAQPTTDPSSTNYKLPWVAGATIRLDQSNATNDNHPLLFTNSDSLITSVMRSGIITNNISYYLDGAASESDYMNTSTFNAASTRYVEITQTAGDTQDFYFACWVHGIGMGGIIDLTQDTWGAMQWGQGAWAQQGDEAVTLTGFQITGTLDTDLDFQIFPGWGTLDWGENGWGSVDAGNETLPSFPITMSLGTLVAETKQEVVLSGFEITGSLADLNPFFDQNLVLPNSLLATGSLGTLGVNAGDDVQIGLTAFSMTGSIGALAPQDNINPLLSSFEITGRVGNLIEATTVIVPITTSLLATGSVGAITPSNNTGVTITDSLLATGTLNASDVTTPDIVLGLTGFEITANIGTQFGILHYGNVDLGSNTSYTDVDTTKAA